MTLRRFALGAVIAVAAFVVLPFVGRRAFFLPPLYFRMAYYLIQRSSAVRDRVDWPTVRAEADELRRGARTTADTYPAIRHVLRRLGDGHSHLADPETVRAHRAGATTTLGLTAIWPERVVATVSPGGAAEIAGVLPGDVVEAVDGRDPAHVETVVLFPREARPIGVTLRRAGEAARTVTLTARVTPFNRPASSGEAITISFRGRPATRSFGEPTAGLPTSNQAFPLVDDAVLVVMVSREADRTGRIYEGRIPPDDAVPIDWTKVGSEDDPVLARAVAWLRSQPQCAR
ncbi:MAG TPA: hypothetical protein VIJ10_16340 [Vicinamibacteria bacterium]